MSAGLLPFVSQMSEQKSNDEPIVKLRHVCDVFSFYFFLFFLHVFERGRCDSPSVRMRARLFLGLLTPERAQNSRNEISSSTTSWLVVVFFFNQFERRRERETFLFLCVRACVM